jgi:hypothetical protein
VQRPRAGRIRLAEAESGYGETGTRDRGPGPGLSQGQGQGREKEIIMVGGSQGLGQDRDLVSGRDRVLTRGPALPRAPVLVPLRLAQGHGHDQGRATGEVFTENVLADLVPEAGPRVAAGVAAGNASVEERGVVRRMCVSCLSIPLPINSCILCLKREKRERRKNGATSAAVGGQWGKYGIITESECVQSFSRRQETVSLTFTP